jgi:hypothetical protein
MQNLYSDSLPKIALDVLQLSKDIVIIFINRKMHHIQGHIWHVMYMWIDMIMPMSRPMCWRTFELILNNY